MKKEEVIKIINENDSFKINSKLGSFGYNKSRCKVEFLKTDISIDFNGRGHQTIAYEEIYSIESDIICKVHNIKMQLGDYLYKCMECIDDFSLKRILNERNLVCIEKIDLKNLRKDVYEMKDTVHFDNVDKFFEKYL